MSLLPYTSLVVNQSGIDVLSHQPDVVYLIAPALSGGEQKDDNGEILLKDGNPVYVVSDVITDLAVFEQEFGLANRGSPASMYAKWIYDYGNFAIRCRRVVSDDVSHASVNLLNTDDREGVQVISTVKDYDSNKIYVDVDVSSGVEHYFGVEKAAFVSSMLKLTMIDSYDVADLLYFDGNISENPFRVGFFGGESEHYLFDVASFLSVMTTTGEEFVNAGDDVALSALEANEFSWHDSEKKFYFGNDVVLGKYNLTVQALLNSGDLVHYYCTAVLERELSFDFDTIEFQHLYLNELGTVNDVKYEKLFRVFNESPTLKISVKLEDSGTGGLRLTIWDDDKTESYVGAVVNDIVEEVNNRSRLVIAESYTNETVLPNYEPTVELAPIGVKITAYDGSTYKVFDNIRNVYEAEQNVDKDFVYFKAVGAQEYLSLKPVIGKKLVGGSSGLTPQIVDYLEAIAEAERLLDVTIIITPGVSDETLHYALNDHCLKMVALGRYRITVCGVALNEQLDEKLRRTEAIASECFVLLGDGLQLKDPISTVKSVFSAAVSVAAFVGLILSNVYYKSLTYLKMRNAYGVEHDYDDAQLNELHEARMVVFKFDTGVKVLDAITTSRKNAYEDIHMVRIFHFLSSIIRTVMEKVKGKANTPPTWGYVLGLIRKYLEGLVDVGAIISFRLLNEVRAEDLVASKFRFRVGVIPVFPVKYVEGVVDIYPPAFVEV